MLGKIIQLFIIFTWIKFTQCQYSVSKINYNLNTCEPSGSSRMVEHFFSLIFTEFHATPPVCTCVQMCPDQPAYCYPNGCMKKNLKENETKSSHEQFRRSAPIHIHKLADTEPVRLFIEDKDDFLAFFEKTHRINSNTEKPVAPVENNLRPSLFKDRYNTLIKYKRMPKVELKYNLREQVRTMKSAKLKIESVDVSKTRWPHPKQIHQKNIETDSETYETNMVMENNPTLVNKGFSKRENTGSRNDRPISKVASNSSNVSTRGQAASNSSLKSIANVPRMTKTISYTESDSNDTTEQNKTSQNKIYVVLRLGENNVLPSDEKTTKLANFDIDSSINLKEPHNNNTYNDIFASFFKSIGKEDNASMEVEERYVDTDNVDFRKTKQHLNEYFNKSDNTSEHNSSIRETNTNAPASIK
ncbi:uncharacterized protein [Choristoneura fumiferana]|uniref:uncharacterized protein n=1 Tax=Choristoneura fumiferana TaxID=7141 RepID=UPI003D157B68